MPLARYLVDKKAFLNLYNIKGETALIIACQKLQFDLVKTLVDNGSNLYFKTDDGQSAFDFVKKETKSEAVETREYLMNK